MKPALDNVSETHLVRLNVDSLSPSLFSVLPNLSCVADRKAGNINYG